MFTKAIVRKPCPKITEGLTSASLGKPNFDNALIQHQNYVSALKSCGLEVTILEAEENYPDSTFVEDTALCTPHCAIITNPGAPSRQGEEKSIVIALEKFYKNIEHIKAPGTVEAGDIMMVESHFYIGLSERTNQEGADQMIKILEKYNLSGSVVTMSEVLHLKTGLSYIENNNLLAAGEFLQKEEFNKFNIIEISKDDSYSANSVWINDKVLVPKGFSQTTQKIVKAGYEVIEVDVSEFQKVDGGLSCLSLRF